LSRVGWKSEQNTAAMTSSVLAAISETWRHF